MRKYLLVFTLILAFFGCEKELIPYCEREHVGIVTVENHTGYPADVDVTWGDIEINYEAFLYHGDSHTYLDIYAGIIEIWIRFEGEEWQYEYHDLTICEHLTFTWLPQVLKSTNGCPFVLTLPDGRTVIPTKKNK